MIPNVRQFPARSAVAASNSTKIVGPGVALISNAEELVERGWGNPPRRFDPGTISYVIDGLESELERLDSHAETDHQLLGAEAWANAVDVLQSVVDVLGRMDLGAGSSACATVASDDEEASEDEMAMSAASSDRLADAPHADKQPHLWWGKRDIKAPVSRKSRLDRKSAHGGESQHPAEGTKTYTCDCDNPMCDDSRNSINGLKKEQRRVLADYMTKFLHYRSEMAEQKIMFEMMKMARLRQHVMELTAFVDSYYPCVDRRLIHDSHYHKNMTGTMEGISLDYNQADKAGDIQYTADNESLELFRKAINECLKMQASSIGPIHD